MSRLHPTAALDNKTQRKQLDLRRMQFRKAIEDYSEQRRLYLETADFPDVVAAEQVLSYRTAAPRSARSVH